MTDQTEPEPTLAELELREQLYNAMDGNLRMSRRRKLLAAYRAEILAAVPAGQAPATDRAAPTDWIDGHPQLEAIAAAVWEQCEHHDSGLIIDDPRTIAVAALAAMPPTPTDRAGLREQIAEALVRMDAMTWLGCRRGDREHDEPIGQEALAERLAEAVLPAPADRAAELAKHVTRAIFALKSPAPPGSEHYRSGWDDGLDAAIDAAREAVDAPLSPFYEHPECGFHWHGRDGMDIPLRDGQPVCPRCELAKVQKQLDHSLRRREEVGAECKRRGRIKLEQAERIILLERELDGVRDQLGKEMLRADDAEAELRRLAAEPAAVSDRAADNTQAAGVQQMLTRMRANAATHDLGELLRLVAVWAASSEGRDVLVEDLIAAGYRLPHACGNCEGIDPDTCLMNPGRAADARPRCPDCQMPHDLTPGMALACASIRASIADRDRPAVGGAQQQETGTVLPCNWTHTRHEHTPHGWEPQPGMDPVRCPGFTKEPS
jgi:hypothetical protein